MILVKVVDKVILRVDYKKAFWAKSIPVRVMIQFTIKILKVKRSKKAIKRPNWPFLMKSKKFSHRKLSTGRSNFAFILKNRGEN